MKKCPVNRQVRDQFAKGIAEIAAEFGAREIEPRFARGRDDIGARYQIETVAGPTMFSGDLDDWGSSVYMRFDGPKDTWLKHVPWPELNRHSGKCNLHLTNDVGGKEVLFLLRVRLEALRLEPHAIH